AGHLAAMPRRLGQVEPCSCTSPSAVLRWHCRIVACEGEFMRKSLSVLAAIFVFGASAAIADPCPPHRPGASYPWDVAGVMSGDQWAELAVNVDTKGMV